jgi:SpoVK/Ycf46/Vps4 family AAA+-type ATPase
LEDLFVAARAQSGGEELTALSRKIQPRYTWSDLVLPSDQMAQIRSICQQVKYQHIVYGQWGFGRKLSLGKGLNALFSGPPGTGKTMTAEVIANELGLDLYKIDLSQVVSKYIGETEKSLNRIFTSAEQTNAILFFDEADALFGKRSEVKDAHDRYANIEIAYLLQKMEEYEGITILTTNLVQNLDEAFTRRIRFIIEFPFPDVENRLEIWRHAFPKETPVSSDVNFAAIAQQFKLAGGNIRNIALSAAFLAAEAGQSVNMAHLLQATRREFQKMGRLINEEEFLHLER